MNQPQSTWLSKSKLTVHRQCERRLWLEVNELEYAVVSAPAKRAFDIGNQVGELARREYSDGTVVNRGSGISAALEQTCAAMHAARKRPVFEATFLHDGVLAIVDVLLPVNLSWRLVEVKSSTSVKPYHIQDVAIQWWVLHGAGVPLERAVVRHLDTTFVYRGGGDYRGLFASTDVRDEVEGLASKVPEWVASARETLSGAEPDTPMGRHCSEPFDCPFRGHCEDRQKPAGAVEYPVTLLPGATGKRIAARLAAAGVSDLREVPAAEISGDRLMRIYQATVSGRPYFDQDAASSAMSSAEFPRFYLDFETINFAVPRWSGTRSYENVPFQWSCHIEHRSGEVDHEEFLDLSGDDPSRACAERLLQVLGQQGAVVSFNAGFEKGVLTRMAQRLPDLSQDLLAVTKRLFDPLPILRETYYHRDMRGSWSIKEVLPAIAPGLTYDDLDEVKDGTSAQSAYLEAIHPETEIVRQKEIDKQLRRYCERDTLAMVAIAEFLLGPWRLDR
jgi:hypothetical protein